MPTGFGVLINVANEGDVPLGLRTHAGERDRQLRRAMDRSDGTVVRRGRESHFFLTDEEPCHELVAELQAILIEVSRKPIGQKVVERVLGITSAERSRWGKDGRLPTSGSTQFRRGTTITLPTYSPIVIEQLANCPALIAEWRARDSER
jgi:hypothetical protein